jgi:anaerobic magnesium-protoporphyrin IX monomethyl ester cyclase
MDAKRTKSILFVIPPYYPVHEYGSNRLTSQQPVFTIPYGVLSLSAYVQANSTCEIKICILDLNLEVFKLIGVSHDSRENIGSLINNTMLKHCPDIVCISALFNTCYNYLELISTSVNETNENALIIIGGGLATNLYMEILTSFNHIDACCYGEGEIPLCQLVNSENAMNYLESSFSWVTRKSLEESRSPDYQFVQDLDEIPYFDFSLIDLKDYTGRALDKSYSQKSLREISLHTSRGCPFDCVFCSNGTVHGKKVRYMSVEKVLNEIERMVNLYQAEVLLIEDDHFLGDKDRARKILKGIIDFHLKIEFPNGIAVYAIDDEIGELLSKAGVTTISLAVESGSNFVLKNIINKPLRVESIRPAVEILRKNRIDVHAFIVIGLPGELETHREETMQMIIDVGFDWVKFFLAIPIAGSRLYELCKKNGWLLTNDFSQYVTTKANIRTPDIDPEYIEDKIYLMNLEANFVRNYNLRKGLFQKAALHFENIARRYPDHAFAHYCLAKAYAGLGKDENMIEHHRTKFLELVTTNSAWQRYSKAFALTLSS